MQEDGFPIFVANIVDICWLLARICFEIDEKVYIFVELQTISPDTGDSGKEKVKIGLLLNSQRLHLLLELLEGGSFSLENAVYSRISLHLSNIDILIIERREKLFRIPPFQSNIDNCTW